MGKVPTQMTPDEAATLRLPYGYELLVEDGEWVVDLQLADADESLAAVRLGMVAYLVANGWFPKPLLDEAWKYVDAETGTVAEADAVRLDDAERLKILEATDTLWPLRDILQCLADGEVNRGYAELVAARAAARALIVKVWKGGHSG